MVARVLAGLAGFAANVLIARLLAPADVGVYFLLVSIVMLGVTVAQGGLQIAVVRLAAEAIAQGLPARARGTILRTLALGGAAAIMIGAAMVLAGPAMSARLAGATLAVTTLGLAGAWVVLLTLVNLAAESLRGLQEHRLASLFGSALPNLANAAALGVLAAFALGGGLDQVVAVVVAVLAGVALLALAVLRARLASLGPATMVSAKEMLALGGPLLVTSLAIFITSQLDLWLVGLLCGKQDVALYGASARLVLLVMMPMLIGNVVLPPLVAELHARGDTQRLENLLRTTATLSALIAVPVLLVLFFAAGPILGIAYGDYYRGGATVLVLLCAGQTVNVLAGPGAIVLMMTGGQREAMAISIACGLILAAGGIAVAGEHGIAGVAAVAGSTSALHGLLCLAAVRYRNRIWTSIGVTHLAGWVASYRARLDVR